MSPPLFNTKWHPWKLELEDSSVFTRIIMKPNQSFISASYSSSHQSACLYFKIRACCYQRLAEMNKLFLCGWVWIRTFKLSLINFMLSWVTSESSIRTCVCFFCLTVRVPGGSLPLRDPFPSHSASDLWPGSGGGGAREEPSQHLGQHGGGLLRPQLHSRGLCPAEEAHWAAWGAGGESEEEAEDDAAEVSAAGETTEEAEGDMWDTEDRSQAASSVWRGVRDFTKTHMPHTQRHQVTRRRGWSKWATGSSSCVSAARRTIEELLRRQ